MSITLPTCPVPTDFQPMLRDFGGVLTPFLGGPEQRINRLGTRFGLRLTLPPMGPDEGMAYIARLLRGRADTVVLPWPLLDFDPGEPGAPLVRTSISGGSTIKMKGITAGYAVKEGQFFSVIHGSHRYVHLFAADGTASGAGTLDVDIFPMLRSPLSTNDVVEIATPKIEGFVSPGEELAWQIGLTNEREVSFSIVEDR